MKARTYWLKCGFAPSTGICIRGHLPHRCRPPDLGRLRRGEADRRAERGRSLGEEPARRHRHPEAGRLKRCDPAGGRESAGSGQRPLKGRAAGLQGARLLRPGGWVTVVGSLTALLVTARPTRRNRTILWTAPPHPGTTGRWPVFGGIDEIPVGPLSRGHSPHRLTCTTENFPPPATRPLTLRDNTPPTSLGPAPPDAQNTKRTRIWQDSASTACRTFAPLAHLPA